MSAPVAKAPINGAISRYSDAAKKAIELAYGQKREVKSLSLFNGSPAEMLAKLVNMSGDTCSILVRNQLVEANELKRSLLMGAYKLREMKQLLKQRINDLESYQSFLKEKGVDITGGKDGKAKKTLTPAEVHEFFSNHKELAQRYGITSSSNTNGTWHGFKVGGKAVSDVGALATFLNKRSYELKDGRVKCKIGTDKVNPFDVGKLSSLIESQKTDEGHIDTQLKIINLQLQEVIQKCQQLVTLDTNMQVSHKKAADSVIANIR